jgi:GT2 family glycosyltransferase/SAM-dependent methyltransferase
MLILKYWRKFGRLLRKVLRIKINNYKLYLSCVESKIGLEVGGPSSIFRKSGILPIYSVIDSLDGCNFSIHTVWEGSLTEGPDSYYIDNKGKKGYQYVSEASDLGNIGSEKYDFVLSSHCIEHIANPFQAISEWIRVLKADGFLVMVVPHKDGTFDHKRTVTTLQHLIDDYHNCVTEEDLSHLQEIIDFHDLSLDPFPGDINAFKERSINNYDNRCFHHHVFDTELVVKIFNYFNLRILDVTTALPHNIFIIGQKMGPLNEKVDNRKYLSVNAEYRQKSPFKNDQTTLSFKDNQINLLRPRPETICAVIVTYHPDSGFSERFKSISRQVGWVVIVDNHSNPVSIALLKEIASQSRAHLILNDSNLGVAFALNQGVDWATRQCYEWTLLFDQDTEADDTLVESYMHIYDGFPEKSKLAIIGANFIESNSQRPMFTFESDDKYAWAEQRIVITSGSLISLPIFGQIGPFRNEFFIDLVDHDYCLKARKMGLKVIIACRPLMRHSIGAATMHQLPWRSAGTSNHAALRRYYMMRNHIVLIKEYFLDDPGWVLSSLWIRIKTILLIFYEKDKVSKFKGTIYGFIDGLKGKMGIVEREI